MQYKLGRHPRAYDPRIPHLSALISGRPLPPPPAAVNYSHGMPMDLGMMLNDRLGDCLVGDTLAVAPGAIQAYRVPYDGPVVSIVTSTGKRLTATRNHMVLTAGGFVPAYRLQTGDYVISTDFPQIIASGVDNDFNDVPTRIEDTFKANNRISLAARKERQMRSSIDFHGDAQFFQGQVNVVDINSFVQSADVAALSQPESKKRFVPIGFTETFDGSSAALAHDHAVSLSSPCRLGLESVGAFLLQRESVRSELAGFGQRSHLHASPTQGGVQQFLSDAELPSELIDRFPLEITLDRVVQVEHQSHSGFVYDLSTAPQWYIANGILTHNCTCADPGHAVQVWSFNARKTLLTPTDQEILSIYEGACGFDPTQTQPDGSNPTDQGGNMQVVRNYLLTHGIPLPGGGVTKVMLWVEVDKRNHQDVMRIIDDCGGISVGFNVPQYLLPDNAAPPRQWIVNPGADQTIIGGHDVFACGYDQNMLTLASWGGWYQMSWAFWDKYVDECYGTSCHMWVSQTGKTPAGLTEQQMETIMRAVRS